MTKIIQTQDEAQLVALLLSKSLQRDVSPGEATAYDMRDVVGALAEFWPMLDQILRDVAAPMIDRAWSEIIPSPYRETRFLSYWRALHGALAREPTIAEASRMYHAGASPEQAADFLTRGLRLA
jgi:hypothetical protein